MRRSRHQNNSPATIYHVLVNNGEWIEVKCSVLKWTVVKWTAVKIFGEMFVLSLIYSYVAVCRFCVVRFAIIICLTSLFSNYSTYVFNIIFMFAFLICLFVFYFVYSAFCIVLCIVSPTVYSCLFPIFCTSLPTSATGWKPNCSKYHISI
jgi:hypothetical protein